MWQAFEGLSGFSVCSQLRQKICYIVRKCLTLDRGYLGGRWYNTKRTRTNQRPIRDVTTVSSEFSLPISLPRRNPDLKIRPEMIVSAGKVSWWVYSGWCCQRLWKNLPYKPQFPPPCQGCLIVTVAIADAIAVTVAVTVAVTLAVAVTVLFTVTELIAHLTVVCNEFRELGLTSQHLMLRKPCCCAVITLLRVFSIGNKGLNWCHHLLFYIF